MTLTEWLILLAIAAICGSLGQFLVGYSVGGCLTSIVIGIVGAYLGLWLAREFGLPELFSLNIGNRDFPILWSIIGSALFAAGLGLISRGVRG